VILWFVWHSIKHTVNSSAGQQCGYVQPYTPLELPEKGLSVVFDMNWSMFLYLGVQGGGYVIVLSVISVGRITDEHRNGRRPNLAGVGKGWPSRSGWLFGGDLDLHANSGLLFLFFCHCGIGHLLAFLIQAIVSLCGSWRNDRRRQVNASTTCWDRSDRDLDPDPY